MDSVNLTVILWKSLQEGAVINTRNLNIVIFLVFSFVAAKSSTIPIVGVFKNTVVQSMFTQFSSGNSEAFSISSSVIAAYIFYVINSYLPRYVKRKKSLDIIGEQLTQIVYRSMCLVYVHENCKDIFSEDLMKKIYKLISYDLSKKISSVSGVISFIAAYPLGAFQVKIRSTFDVSRLMLYENRSDSPQHCSIWPSGLTRFIAFCNWLSPCLLLQHRCFQHRLFSQFLKRTSGRLNPRVFLNAGNCIDLCKHF